MSACHTHLRWILIPLAILLFTGSAGCRQQKPALDPAQLRDFAANQFEQAQSFHFVLTHSHGTTTILNGMQLVQAEGDVTKSNQLHATLLVQTLGAQLHLQLIGIDDRTWMTNPFNPNQWQPLQGVRAQDILNLGAIPQALRAMNELRVTGQTNQQGTPMAILEGTLTSTALRPVIPNGTEDGLQLNVQLWIGANDHRLYQVILNGPLTKSEPRDIQRTLSLSKYDAPVTITPPTS